MFELMELPYKRDALDPAISEETIDYHYGKHHQGYVDNLNKLIDGTTYEDMSLEDIIRTANEGPLFNNAAQIFNHNLYWNSLTPENVTLKSQAQSRIEKYYGSLDSLKTTILSAASKHFSNGWVWVCAHEDESLFVQDTHDAGTPIVDPLVTPLIVIDFWEHAHYVQYRNDRRQYLEAVLEIIDWNLIGAETEE